MSFATKQRILLGIAVMLMFVPTFLYSAGLLGRAPIFEGDERKEMTCLTCEGLGKVKEESCKTCRGIGVADFIIPGPNRPIQLVGTILDASKNKVEGAEIAVRQASGDATEVILASNPDGQFGIKLPPGQYVARVSAPDKGKVETKFSISQNETPLPARGSETLHVIQREFQLGVAP